MRISMIGVLPPLTGLSYYCYSLAKSLQDKIDIDFYSFKKLYPEFIHKGKKIGLELKSLRLGKVNEFRSLTYYNPFSWIYTGLKVKTRLVHLQLWSLPPIPIIIFLSLILKIRRKKLILTVHNVNYDKYDFIYSFLTKFLLLFIDSVIVHSELNKEEFIEKFKFRNIFVIPHGAFDIYKKISEKEARKKLGFNDEKIILNFGLIRDYKGIDDLINAFEDINGKLVIAGEVWGDSSYYKNLIKKSKREKDIIFINRYLSINDVSLYLSACDLVVLPYKKGFGAVSGVGSVVIYFGKPLLVSNSGGLKDLVLDKNAIFEPGNIKELHSKLDKILSNNGLLKKLGNDSLKLSKKYSWDKVARDTLKIYNLFN